MSEHGYNDCPGRDVIQHELTKRLGDGRRSFTYIDTDAPYWKNETDTLVIAIDAYDRHSVEQVALAYETLYDRLLADEVHHKMHGSKIIIRAWWD